MDYLQYYKEVLEFKQMTNRFKPCYKWITFNTIKLRKIYTLMTSMYSFKPCYKWITFNTII